MGLDHIAFMGGSVAFWVRSKVNGQTGAQKIRIKSSVGVEKEIEVNLVFIDVFTYLHFEYK